MGSAFPAWLAGAADGIRRLADRPGTLFLLLLALNAIARPCSPTAHDARLYSLQALNQAEAGAYGDDIFLRYGSQDQFSLFSRMAGPMVAAIGVRSTFFALYLVFNTLFIFAMFRLVRALIDDTVIATLSLIFLATASLPYGGGGIFTVHEQFFTPRIIGTAMTLFALERMLRGRLVQALLFLLAGSAMHPLMAFGGVMIWAGCVASTMSRWLLAALVAAAVAADILIPMFGTRIFGELDADWHGMIRTAVGYNYPDTWTYKDWLNLAVSFAVPIAACFTIDSPQRRRFVIIAVVAGAVGFFATVAASMLPYGLLFQGQPYRVLWILKVLQIPLGFWLVARWSQAPSLWLNGAALALVAYFCVTHYLLQELLFFAIALPISVFVARIREESWWYGTARGLAFGALGWMAYRWFFFATRREQIAQYFDLNEWLLFDLVSPILLLMVVIFAVQKWHDRAVRWTSATVALLIPGLLFATEMSPPFRQHHTRLGAEIALVTDFIGERDGRRPSVYCSFGRSDLLWIDVRTTSYFSIIQTAGVLFNRQSAVEIQRRAEVVAKFEMAQQRAETLSPDPGKEAAMSALFKVDFHCAEPTRDDLIRLCREAGLDYVVIPQKFDGLYSATNGRIFVYECYKVNAASGVAKKESP